MGNGFPVLGGSRGTGHTILCFLTNPKFHMAKQAQVRQVIYVSDIKLLTGKSESTASREMALVKDALGLKESHFLTIKAYCAYRGLDYESALATLGII